MGHFLFVVAVIVVGALLWAASPIVTVVFVAWLLFAIAGYVIGEPKGRGPAGILLASFTGPIGLLILAMLAPTRARQRELEHGRIEAPAPSQPV